MDNKIKKLIAREGLVLLSLLMFGFILLFLGNYLNSRPIDLLAQPPESHHNFDILLNVAYILIIAGYPFYLLTRFIVWAIRTLKQRN